jgi:hypothetical protein
MKQMKLFCQPVLFIHVLKTKSDVWCLVLGSACNNRHEHDEPADLEIKQGEPVQRRDYLVPE